MLIDNLRDETLNQLFESMMALETVEEFYQFFDDLCTTNEIILMKQRFHVAMLLRENRTYTDIQELTGASSSTVSRVKRCLDYGSGGYRTALDRLDLKD